MEILGLVSGCFAVAGVVLNNRLNRACFILWLLSNAASGVIHVETGVWSLALRDAVFFVLAAEGWFLWSKRNINHKGHEGTQEGW